MNWNRIILIGFMGTGKTTIGILLAEKLQIPFIDTDDVIETDLGRTITDIFTRDGEPFFRSHEDKVVRKALQNDSVVMATGGGVITNPDTYRFMKERGIVISLDASMDVLWSRLQDSENRPMLKKQYPKEQMLHLYQSRQPLYEQAHYSFLVDDKAPAEIMNEIVDLIKKEGNG